MNQSHKTKNYGFSSRREHSSKEIYQKLSRRVESKEMLLQSIEDLKETDYLAMKGLLRVIFSRKRRGLTLKIRNELIQRGVKESFFYSLNEETTGLFALDALKKR